MPRCPRAPFPGDLRNTTKLLVASLQSKWETLK
jgi:hypothetical protein